jgi:hypothetical protein
MIGDFLKPPTDNLYKFMALSGLLTQLLFFVFIPWNLQRAVLAHAEAASGVEILKIDAEDVARKKNEAETDIERLQSEQAVAENRLATLRSQLENSSRLNSSERTSELRELTVECNNRAKLIREIRDAVNEEIISAHKKKAELTAKVKYARVQWELGIAYSVLLLLLAVGGFFLTLKGFFLWFDRVQKFQDAILRGQATSELDAENGLPLETTT